MYVIKPKNNIKQTSLLLSLSLILINLFVNSKTDSIIKTTKYLFWAIIVLKFQMFSTGNFRCFPIWNGKKYLNFVFHLIYFHSTGDCRGGGNERFDETEGGRWRHERKCKFSSTQIFADPDTHRCRKKFDHNFPPADWHDAGLHEKVKMLKTIRTFFYVLSWYVLIWCMLKNNNKLILNL